MLDPDIRFLLANERTLLAWVRTALALIVGGLALTQFGDTSTTSLVGITVILTGAIMTLIGLARFKSADKAIRKGQLPASGYGPQLQVIAVVTLTLVLITIEVFKII
jgi:putative membrane protein